MVLKDAMTATLSMVTAAAPRAVSKEAGPAQVEPVYKQIHAFRVSSNTTVVF